VGRRTFGCEHQWWLRVFRQRPGHVECPNVRGRPRNNLHWPITQVVEQGRYCVAVLADNRICALSCDKLAGLACEISESKSTVVNISLARRQKWQRDPIGRCIPDQERCLHDEASSTIEKANHRQALACTSTAAARIVAETAPVAAQLA